MSNNPPFREYTGNLHFTYPGDIHFEQSSSADGAILAWSAEWLDDYRLNVFCNNLEEPVKYYWTVVQDGRHYSNHKYYDGRFKAAHMAVRKAQELEWIRSHNQEGEQE